MRIAVSIPVKSNEYALACLDKAERAGADIAELRIDFMTNPDLERLVKYGRIPRIITNRPTWEGGNYSGEEEIRLEALQRAINLGVDYVDVEFKADHRLYRRGAKLIVSYHNFDETPENLEEIYDQICAREPDIVKIATKAQNSYDTLRILDLIKNADRPIIGIGMGEEGVSTRILGPVHGAYLTFVSLDDEPKTAPGQLTISELREAWKKGDVL